MTRENDQEKCLEKVSGKEWLGNLSRKNYSEEGLGRMSGNWWHAVVFRLFYKNLLNWLFQIIRRKFEKNSFWEYQQETKRNIHEDND